MNNYKIIPILAILLLLTDCIQAQTLRAGAAVRKITPDPLLPVSGGIGIPDPVTGKKGDLFAHALVFEKGDSRIAIISVDNIGWTSVLGDRSRALIKGIQPQNILISATHTHSAPDAYGFPDEQGKSYADLNYLDWCTKQIADAANEAVKNLQPAALKISVGEARGKIAYNYYAPDLYDPRCGVIQAIAADGTKKGKPIATLVNYAIHPEVIGPDRGILSPDLCGPLYERIEMKTGGMAIFINSAQGGMVTADNRRENGKETNDWEECIRIGELLADEALRIIADAGLETDPDISCISRKISFPIEAPVMKYIFHNTPLKFPGNSSDSVSTTICLLDVGSARILTIPGEALPNIGFYLKRKMNTEHSFIFGLTNDAFGYILTRVDFNSFKRYEYITRTSLGEMTGEILIKEALNLLNYTHH